MNSSDLKFGDVWLINLSPTVGAEITKTRPAVIVNDNALGKLPLKVIVPLTDWKDRYILAPWLVKIVPNTENNLAKESAADCFQIRSVSVDRFIRSLGTLDGGTMDDIQTALKKVLFLNSEKI
jgi:mRNA interferase MazF